MRSNDLRFIEYFNDPVWGEIPVTQVELDIINTKTFRRLQHIKQMGCAYLSFPTANHRRFEHSIGTMHVAHLLSEILVDALKSEDRDELDITSAQFQALRLSALLHDVGHAPYSHAFEEAVKKNPWMVEIRDKSFVEDGQYAVFAPLAETGTEYRHELFTEYIVQNDEEISPILEAWAQKSGGFPGEQIGKLSAGNANYLGLKLFNLIISGDFDADRIDYVCRDSYYCGFSQRFRLQELRRNVSLRKDGNDGNYQLRLKENAIPVITTLLWYRYRLMKSVHLDRANRIATQVLVQSLSEKFAGLSKYEPKNISLDEKKLKTLLAFHTKMTDEDCNQFLRRGGGPSMQADLVEGKLPQEVYSIGHRHLNPDEKVFLHFMMNEIRAIPALEKKLRSDVDKEIMIDVRLAKAPKLKVMVQDEGSSEPRSIFDNYYTPHGIMIDSFGTLGLYLYHPHKNAFDDKVNALGQDYEKEPFKFPTPPLRHIIYRSIKETYVHLRKDWDQEKIVFSLEFLLIVLGSIEAIAAKEFGRRPWTTGDGRLQKFVRTLVSQCTPENFRIFPLCQYK